MELKPILSSIDVYPIKSLDGMTLKEATISEGGCLLHDREYVLMDEFGEFINGKSNPLVHSLRSMVDFEKETVAFRLHLESEWNEFHLIDEKLKIESYLSDYFGKKVYLLQDRTGRFLDIPDISGVTIISKSSLETVGDWFSISLDESRKRFRTTLEFENVSAFWEDQLFIEEGRSIELKIGEVTVFGMSPRARCIVPTRNPETAEVRKAFPKLFSKYRKSNLPVGSLLPSYGHFYHLSVDCMIPASEIGKIIRLGDELIIVGEKKIE